MTPKAVNDQFSLRIAQFTQDITAPRIGVAVSGGGDSMALLDLTRRWACEHGATVMAATVDHGLRDVAAEIALVADYCAQNAIPHAVLRWSDWDEIGNLQAAARTARHNLLRDWAVRQNLDLILYGHTADDQAETVLMRLARGSGVDGLAGMRDQDRGIGRPLLDLNRADLRDYLRAQGIAWADDPSNDDLQFDRIKARKMLPLLAELGLTPDRLRQTAAHMQGAQRSLRDHAAEFAKHHVTADRGDLIFDAQALQIMLTDTPARVFSAAIQWIGGGGYRPRYAALCDAAAALLRGETRTLGGVLMTPEATGARLTREFDAALDITPVGENAASCVWDHRWVITPGAASDPLQKSQATFDNGMYIKALGDDLRHVADWRACGLPRASLLSSPALYRGDTLIAAPVADNTCGWSASISPHFATYLLMH